MVTGDERCAGDPVEQRRSDTGRARRGDVDRVVAPLGKGLRQARQARNAEAHPGVEGDFELCRGWQAAIDAGVGADDLDLEPRCAELTDLLDRRADAVGGADPVRDQGDPRPLAGAAGQLRLLRAEKRRCRCVGHGRDQGIEETADRPGDVAFAGRRGALGDRAAQAPLMGATGAAVEVGVGEVLLLEVGEQLAPAQVQADRAEPGLEQRAGVVGPDIGGDLALSRRPLADHPLRDLQDRRRIRRSGAPYVVYAHIRRTGSGEVECAGGQCHRCVRPLGSAALFAAGCGVAGAQVGEKLFRRGGRGRLRERAADVHAGVIVGAADAGAAVRLGVDRGGHVQLRRARAVSHLPDRKELGQAAAVARCQRRVDVVERVRERGGDLVLGKVRGAGLQIAGVCLQPLVVSGGDPITEDVNRLGLAGEASGQLLGDEAIGTIGELETAVDRVVVGDRDEVHPPPLGQLVNLFRGRRTLGQPQRALNPEPRELRGGGMAMHVNSGNHRRLPCSSRFCHLQNSLLAGKTCEQPGNSP